MRIYTNNANSKLTLKLVSSLEKVFLTKEPNEINSNYSLSGLHNERVSFQIAFKNTSELNRETFSIETVSELKDFIKIYKAESVPVETTGFGDENYISNEPGLYPDLLTPIQSEFNVRDNKWNSLWIEVNISEKTKGGIYPIKFIFKDEEKNELNYIETELEVIDATLPKQKIKYTQWFHTDCIANYYNIDVFSDRYWDICKNFLQVASDYGINMILTPIFTPPLDTKIGGERLTVQLVDVYMNDGKYSFDFKKLDKWIDMLNSVSIEYIEISHLFSQWGAKYAPKIMGYVNGQYKKLFGWDTLATCKEYTEFLNTFLPELKKFLKNKNVLEKCYFHISDEPNFEQIDDYTAAISSIKSQLDGLNVIDALSDYEFYKNGLIKRPVVATNCVEPFLENDVKNLWVYYCCGQTKNVSNRFIAMPSWRNRIIATQLYKYDIEGFLHWGYNFYNAQYSLYPINPYVVTDAEGAFPSGDSFSVYPSQAGTALPSIRLFVFYEALCDLRAMKLLEDITSKEYVLNLIEKTANQSIEFDSFPKNQDYILNLRNMINNEIKAHIG